MAPLAAPLAGHAADGPQDAAERGERGYRRQKLAAMAGSLYRSGQQAVTDLRDSYAHSRARGPDGEPAPAPAAECCPHIPSAFPDVAIAANDDEQMVLFPSYAKRHDRRHWARDAHHATDEDYWRQQWERHEDQKAVVDVDVRGWLYAPQDGPLTRRNRILIGLARQLSGISAPAHVDAAHHQAPPQEEVRDQEKIANEAALIERRGQQEKRVACGGGYSEQPPGSGAPPVIDAAAARLPDRSAAASPMPSARQTQSPMPSARQTQSPMLSARHTQTAPAAHELSDAELAVANANLMARVAPFLAYPLVAVPVTMFFYNDTQSQSRTVVTNDAGHFAVRAQLDFVPTHVRVLADERLSATQPVRVTEPHGVSLISDVDDTVKHSNILAGAREIFRNTFTRDLSELGVDGVREWYGRMHHLGVSIHYCSNSPWQLFPVLDTFFKRGGLPVGSLHLKQYSGMLQGIFEPVAERKKTTLNHLMSDFPTRSFLLVGDSGEADLEVYTELAVANPGRILAIFIRDVTTPPEKAGFFDSAAHPLARPGAGASSSSSSSSRSTSTIRREAAGDSVSAAKSAAAKAAGPLMGTLVDLDPEPANGSDQSLRKKPVPPPRPSKPVALRSRPSSTAEAGQAVGSGADGAETPPPQPPRPGQSAAARHTGRLRPTQPPRSASYGSARGREEAGSRSSGPPPPPPRSRAGTPRSGTPRSSANSSPPVLPQRRGPLSNADVDFEPLPPPSAPPPTTFGLGYFSSGPRPTDATPSDSPMMGPQAVNKKLELWLRRLERAQEELDRQGVALYTWRKGQDVMVEAEAIIKEALQEMERRKG